MGVCIKLRLVHNLVNVACRIHSRLIFKALHQSVLGFFRTETGQFLQFLTLLNLHFLQFFLLNAEELVLIVQTQLHLLNLLFAPSQFFLTLVKRYLTLFQTVLVLLYFLISDLDLLLKLRFLVQELFLYLKQFLFLDDLSLFVGSIYHLVVFALYNISENRIARDSAYNKSHGCCNYYTYTCHIICFMFVLVIFPYQTWLSITSSISEVSFLRTSL